MKRGTPVTTVTGTFDTNSGFFMTLIKHDIENNLYVAFSDSGARNIWDRQTDGRTDGQHIMQPAGTSGRHNNSLAMQSCQFSK